MTAPTPAHLPPPNLPTPAPSPPNTPTHYGQPGPGTVLSDILHSQVPGEGLNLGTAFSVLQIPLPPKLSQVTRLASGQRLSPEVMLVLPPLLILLPPFPTWPLLSPPAEPLIPSA